MIDNELFIYLQTDITSYIISAVKFNGLCCALNDRYKYPYRILSEPCYSKVNIKTIDNIHKSCYKVIG